MDNKRNIEFTAKNVKEFTSWLKRFASIGNSLLLEIDEKTLEFISKTYDEERSVVKMSRINFSDAGLTIRSSKDPKRVKVGIFNILRLIKIIDQFNDEFDIIINCQEVVNDDSTTQYAGEKIILKNESLKITVDCTSLKIFKYISDDLFKNTIASAENKGTFELTKNNLEKINSLCTLDNEYKSLEFKFKDNKVYVSGKTFELLVEGIKANSASLNVFKEQYSKIDNENYKVDLCEDRLVFKSKDSDTICVLSMTSETE